MPQDLAEPVRVPAAEFMGPRFWRWLDGLTARDHDGHPLWLRGVAEATERYDLWCQRCERSAVEMIVDRQESI